MKYKILNYKVSYLINFCPFIRENRTIYELENT